MADESTIESQRRSASMANEVDYANFQRFYANHVQMNTSLFEIRLVLNFINGINAETGHLVALESLIVSMSPELARGLHNMLTKALENYTREYGQLRVPSSGLGTVVYKPMDEETKQAVEMLDTIQQSSNRDDK